jgi:hypothetical protein
VNACGIQNLNTAEAKVLLKIHHRRNCAGDEFSGTYHRGSKI